MQLISVGLLLLQIFVAIFPSYFCSYGAFNDSKNKYISRTAKDTEIIMSKRTSALSSFGPEDADPWTGLVHYEKKKAKREDSQGSWPRPNPAGMCTVDSKITPMDIPTPTPSQSLSQVNLVLPRVSPPFPKPSLSKPRSIKNNLKQCLLERQARLSLSLKPTTNTSSRVQTA